MLLHQLAYSAQSLKALSKDIEARIKTTYERAIRNSALKELFAFSDQKEYFANGVRFLLRLKFKLIFNSNTFML